MAHFDPILPSGTGYCGPCGNVLCSQHGCQKHRPAEPQTFQRIPSFDEQLGSDPMSKLARAIERLCDLLEKKA